MIEAEASAKQKKSSPAIKLIVIAAAILGLVLLSRVVDIPEAIRSSLNWIEGLGFLGYFVFVLLYIVACVLLLPGLLLTLGGGFLYGLPVGFALVSVGSTLGACAAFLVGRYLARDWVSTKIAGNPKFAAIDRAVTKQGWKIVFLTRLSPALPFNLQNYGYGLTNVPLSHYCLASWIGMMPMTLLYVYFGSAAESLATLGPDTGDSSGNLVKYVLLGVGLVVTIIVTIFVTKVARKALNEAVEPDEAD